MRVPFLLVLLVAAPAMGNEFFVSPTGSDTASGSRQTPWQTVAKANATVRPGDTVTLLAGDYPGCIEPAASGDQGRPITYRAQEPLAARLIGGTKSSDGWRTCIRLKQKSFIVLDGFDITPPTPQMWLQMTACQRCAIRNCRMQNGGGSYHPAYMTNCHYCRFEGLDISRAMQVDRNGHVVGNMFGLCGSSRNVLQDCRFGKAGHNPCLLEGDATHNVVRRCVFDCRWGRDFEFFTAPHTLVEGCVITNGYHGSGSADGRAKLFLWEGIFRRNLIYRNWHQPLTIHAYRYRQRDPFGMVNSRLYHNTFYRNYESGFEMCDIAANPEPHMVRGNVLQNNLFAMNDPGGDGIQLGLGGNIARDNRFVGNLFWAGKPGLGTVKYVWPQPASSKSPLRSASEANAQLPEQFVGNVEGDPGFARKEADDYCLTKLSAARKKGLPLALTTRAGQGNSIPVTDARMFYDGFGIPGESGDLVFIGPVRLPARVVKADVERGLLELDRSVKYGQEDWVTLPYTGSAPDIGAYETDAEREPWYLAPRPTPEFRMTTMETANGPFAMTGFEPENLEQWFFRWYTHRQPNTQAEVTDRTAYQGKHSLRVFAVDDHSTLSVLMRPAWWDIDRFPLVKFAYRIPPKTPVGLRLDAFPSQKRGDGAMYVGGTATRASSRLDTKTYTMTDDDQWHVITIDVRQIRAIWPEVKLLRTFWLYTQGNAKKGQEFWIDEFQIEQEPSLR